LTQRINELTKLLSLERKSGADLKVQLGTLFRPTSGHEIATLGRRKANWRRRRLSLDPPRPTPSPHWPKLSAETTQSQQQLSNEQARRKAAEDDIARRDEQLRSAQTTVDQLNEQLAALRKQLQEIAAALDLSESKK